MMRLVFDGSLDGRPSGKVVFWWGDEKASAVLRRLFRTLCLARTNHSSGKAGCTRTPFPDPGELSNCSMIWKTSRL